MADEPEPPLSDAELKRLRQDFLAADKVKSAAWQFMQAHYPKAISWIVGVLSAIGIQQVVPNSTAPAAVSPPISSE